jgi:hypothetical protein
MTANASNWLPVPANAANLSYPKITFLPNYTVTTSTLNQVTSDSASGNLITANLRTPSSDTLLIRSVTSGALIKLQTSTSPAPNSTQLLQLGNSNVISHSNVGFTITNPSIHIGNGGSAFKAIFHDSYNLPNSATNNLTVVKSFVVPAGMTLGSSHTLLLHLDKTQDSGFSDAFTFTFNPVTLSGNSGAGYTLFYSFQVWRVDSNAGWGSSTFSLSFFWLNS